MTYGEIGSLLECTADEARDYTRRENLDRKRSRDGQTRTKINSELTALFVAKIRSADCDIDRAVATMHHMHELMRAVTSSSEPSDPRQRSAAG